MKFDRVPTVIKSHVKSWKMKIGFPGLEKSWKRDKWGKVMEFEISLKPEFVFIYIWDGLLVAGLFFTAYPPSWEKIPPVEDPG